MKKFKGVEEFLDLVNSRIPMLQICRELENDHTWNWVEIHIMSEKSWGEMHTISHADGRRNSEWLAQSVKFGR